MSAEKLVDLVASFAVCLAFGSLGVMALVASCVRVNEARLPRLLAKARIQFAAPVSGPLPVGGYWWAYRFAGASMVIVSQVAVFRVLTGSGTFYPDGVLLPWAVAQWVILLPWSGWVVWAFLRATGPGGTLPLKVDPAVQPSRYRLKDGPAWTEPTDDQSVEEGKGQSNHWPDGG